MIIISSLVILFNAMLLSAATTNCVQVNILDTGKIPSIEFQQSQWIILQEILSLNSYYEFLSFKSIVDSDEKKLQIERANEDGIILQYKSSSVDNSGNIRFIYSNEDPDVTIPGFCSVEICKLEDDIEQSVVLGSNSATTSIALGASSLTQETSIAKSENSDEVKGSLLSGSQAKAEVTAPNIAKSENSGEFKGSLLSGSQAKAEVSPQEKSIENSLDALADAVAEPDIPKSSSILPPKTSSISRTPASITPNVQMNSINNENTNLNSVISNGPSKALESTVRDNAVNSTSQQTSVNEIQKPSTSSVSSPSTQNTAIIENLSSENNSTDPIKDPFAEQTSGKSNGKTVIIAISVTACLILLAVGILTYFSIQRARKSIAENIENNPFKSQETDQYEPKKVSTFNSQEKYQYEPETINTFKSQEYYYESDDLQNIEKYQNEVRNVRPDCIVAFEDTGVFVNPDGSLRESKLLPL